MRHHLPKRKPLDPCPIETVLALVQAKWTSRILHLLFQTPQHFGAIRRGLPGISSEVLAARLGALIRDGLIESQPCTDPRRRSYQPTARGRSLQPVLQAVAEWGLESLVRGVLCGPELSVDNGEEGEGVGERVMRMISTRTEEQVVEALQVASDALVGLPKGEWARFGQWEEG